MFLSHPPGDTRISAHRCHALAQNNQTRGPGPEAPKGNESQSSYALRRTKTRLCLTKRQRRATSAVPLFLPGERRATQVLWGNGHRRAGLVGPGRWPRPAGSAACSKGIFPPRRVLRPSTKTGGSLWGPRRVLVLIHAVFQISDTILSLISRFVNHFSREMGPGQEKTGTKSGKGSHRHKADGTHHRVDQL